MRSINVRTGRGEKAFPLELRRLNKGTRLYRWIPVTDDTWVHYNEHEWVRGMVEGGARELEGAILGRGLYVSENPYDWYRYENATKLVVTELDDDAFILDLAPMMSRLEGEKMHVRDFAKYLNDQYPDFLINSHNIIGYEHKGEHNGEIVLIGVNSNGRTLHHTTDVPRFEDFDFKGDLRWLRAPDHTSRLVAIHRVLRHIFRIDLGRDDDIRKRFLIALECIDYYDLLRELSTNRSQPWNRYGPDFIRRWIEARRMHLGPAATDREILNQLYRIIHNGEALKFRSRDIIAGGGMRRNGEPERVADTGDGQFYFRATEHQYNELRRAGTPGGNPFVRITTDSGLIAGAAGRPLRFRDIDASYAVRYKYPGLHNFEDLARHYPSLEGLRAEYVALSAEIRGIGLDPNNLTTESVLEPRLRERYGTFISNMLQELFEKILSEDVPVSEKYQKLMSVHPFPDGNGRVLRAFFRYKTDGAPLFMPTWDFDILYSRADFDQIVYNGIIEFYRIAHSILQAPDTPDSLLNTSALWDYVKRSSAFNISSEISVDQIQHWFRDADWALFSKKLVLDIQYGLSQLAAPVPAAAHIVPAPVAPAAHGGAGAAAVPARVAVPPAAEGGAGREVIRIHAGGAGAALFREAAPLPEERPWLLNMIFTVYDTILAEFRRFMP